MTRPIPRRSVLAPTLAVVLALVSTTPAARATPDLVMPKLDEGQQFVYETRAAEKAEEEGPRATFREERGLGLVTPLPYRQTVQITGTEACGEHTCLVLEAEQDVPPFVPKLKDLPHGKEIRALVDLTTGEVLDIRTKLLIGPSISNSNQARYDEESTVAEFYGPWMARLHDDYSVTYDRSTGEVRSFEVTGREKVGGRDCFVVHRKRTMPSKQVVESTLWVDTERRVALRVEQAGQTMELAP